MALLESGTSARKFGAKAAPPRYAAVPSPGLLDKIARCYVAVALLIYVADLLRQTHDGLTDGVAAPVRRRLHQFLVGPVFGLASARRRNLQFRCLSRLRAKHRRRASAGLQLQLSAVASGADGAAGARALQSPDSCFGSSGGWFAFYRALRLAMPNGRTLLLALATPAVFVNAVGGQNGTWTAALFGGGLGLLDRRPIIAGSLLGLLIYKPQLGILIPIALLAGRRWQALAAAAATGAAASSPSVWFGLGPISTPTICNGWHSIRHFSLEDGTGVWHRIAVGIRRGAPAWRGRADGLYACRRSSQASPRLPSRRCGFAMRLSASEMRRLCSAPVWRHLICRITTWCSARWSWRGYGKTRRSGGCRNFRSFSPAPPFFLIPLFAASLAHLTGLELGPLFILPLFVIAVKCGLAERPSVELAAAE